MTKQTSARKVLIFVVAYNAENHIESVLNRIPAEVFSQQDTRWEILIGDDGSKDRTYEVACEYVAKSPYPITVIKNPVNLGYGGNQKMGYTYAIKNGYDLVIMLHGDGQYAPEMVQEMAEPILKGEADCVLGSRMVYRKDALKGGMPKYKWLGNIVLTRVQNLFLKTKLTEFHTGYRAYSTHLLKNIPFLYDSDWFDFDTEILIQVVARKFRINEIAIPTHYGNEICHVNGLSYAWKVAKVSCLYFIQSFGIFYDKRFDFHNEKETHYADKSAFESSHSFALKHIPDGSRVLEVNCGGFSLTEKLKAKNCKVYASDIHSKTPAAKHADFFWQNDLIKPDFRPIKGETFDFILLLDVVQHFSHPEALMLSLRETFGDTKTQFIITVPNIGFFTMRAMLLLGRFNYGTHGILDMSHKRLFTFRTFNRLLTDTGFKKQSWYGIPVPFPLAVGDRPLAYRLLKLNHWLIKCWKGMFAFQIGAFAVATPTLEALLQHHSNKQAPSSKQPKARKPAKKLV